MPEIQVHFGLNLRAHIAQDRAALEVEPSSSCTWPMPGK
jgi:hypothetical protein